MITIFDKTGRRKTYYNQGSLTLFTPYNADVAVPKGQAIYVRMCEQHDTTFSLSLPLTEHPEEYGQFQQKVKNVIAELFVGPEEVSYANQ